MNAFYEQEHPMDFVLELFRTLYNIGHTRKYIFFLIFHSLQYAVYTYHSERSLSSIFAQAHLKSS